MNGEHIIERAGKQDYPELVEVWEAAVRATHHFLPEAYIQAIRPLLLTEYLDLVGVYCIRDNQGGILGFIGVLGNKAEMLFVHPKTHGKGVGKLLMHYAIKSMGVTTVDVNEQNEGAVGFYHRLGFRTVSRSAEDAMGKPYPILHLELGEEKANIQ
jgi:putative acetyltransferase